MQSICIFSKIYIIDFTFERRGTKGTHRGHKGDRWRIWPGTFRPAKNTYLSDTVLPCCFFICQILVS